MILANDVIVENLADFLRRRDAVPRFTERGLGLLADDVLAQLNAFIADEHRRPSDELADLMLALPAERAIDRVLRIAACDLAHSCLSSLPGSRYHICGEFRQPQMPRCLGTQQGDRRGGGAKSEGRLRN